MRNDKDNLIVNITFEFALEIIEFVEELKGLRKFVLANQLLKSGTSIGANVREAQNAESKNDFIHKLKIAAKEADETEYFLLLCKLSKTYPFNEALMEKLKSIIKVLSKIIASSKSQSSNFQITKSSN
ncbi:four helix bundle protein [Mucilaginibacter sp. L3T2-6]|uniref:four helix bundle protein n=1 Tax=Mucilaginibacter sp. L3T2-6 TaxID=3062491 RepID=UPI002676E17F|nr:four helix bundle protein [Mucilaginibacter sp. L3T2-6]MDO3642936.1 four helix bundle protein [Mucilaginibacter sp. L3T2-6]MDV6215261.1 four helix bundle protein [Mucilaginibacter sp. L3T2-6]